LFTEGTGLDHLARDSVLLLLLLPRLECRERVCGHGRVLPGPAGAAAGAMISILRSGCAVNALGADCRAAGTRSDTAGAFTSCHLGLGRAGPGTHGAIRERTQAGDKAADPCDGRSPAQAG